MQSFAPAVGPDTAILPLLNGMRHLDVLDERFGNDAVLGGQCVISGTLDDDGRVRHLNDSHLLSFGARDASGTARVKAISSVFAGAKFEARASDVILQEMWEKWVFIATGAGITCLMRASIGDIVAAGGADLATALFDECAAIAARQGFPAREAAVRMSRAMYTAAGSGFMASMLRDIERYCADRGRSRSGRPFAARRRPGSVPRAAAYRLYPPGRLRGTACADNGGARPLDKAKRNPGEKNARRGLRAANTRAIRATSQQHIL